jgi:hypothetical protein
MVEASTDTAEVSTVGRFYAAVGCDTVLPRPVSLTTAPRLASATTTSQASLAPLSALLASLMSGDCAVSENSSPLSRQLRRGAAGNDTQDVLAFLMDFVSAMRLMWVGARQAAGRVARGLIRLFLCAQLCPPRS